MSSASGTPIPRDWIMGDIEVSEGGKLHTYPFAVLLSFGSLEDFRAAKPAIDALLSPDSKVNP